MIFLPCSFICVIRMLCVLISLYVLCLLLTWGMILFQSNIFLSLFWNLLNKVPFKCLSAQVRKWLDCLSAQVPWCSSAQVSWVSQCPSALYVPVCLNCLSARLHLIPLECPSSILWVPKCPFSCSSKKNMQRYWKWTP